MSGDKYFIRDQQGTYFLTCTVVHWIDLFTRRDYRDFVVESLNYCVQEKGLRVHAWVIMSNHIHLLGYCKPPFEMSSFLRDFKKFTSKKFIEIIKTIPESRREWLLDKFAFEAQRIGRASNYKIWKDDNHATDMNSIDIWQKIAYIHDNPVRNGIVANADDYLYSSACNYIGKQGLLQVENIN